MSLSAPVPRKMLHSRQIHCEGYERDDGLWDIEASIVDKRTHDLPTFLGPPVRANEPLHQMSLRITIDSELVIRHLEAVTENAPNPECKEISSAYAQLVGMKIAPGFSGKVKRLFLGRSGCTHLTDLLGPLATTALQTYWAHLVIAGHWNADALRAEAESDKKPPMIDTCYAHRSDGEVSRIRWPKFYTGDKNK